MKTLGKLIYNFFYWLDEKLGNVEEIDYETAPYCGHHHSGHNGKFTESRYHEGDGEAYTKFKLFTATIHTDEGASFFFHPVVRFKTEFGKSLHFFFFPRRSNNYVKSSLLQIWFYNPFNANVLHPFLHKKINKDMSIIHFMGMRIVFEPIHYADRYLPFSYYGNTFKGI